MLTHPTPAQLQQLQNTFSQANSSKTLEILIRGDALDAPLRFLINADNTRITPVSDEPELALNVASRDVILPALAQEAPHLYKLYLALETALSEVRADQDNTQDDVSLNEVLSRAIPHFNNALSAREESFRVNEHKGRTKIVNFTQALARSCERLALSNGASLSAFDTLIAQTKRQGPSVYSIGGGQTLTLLLLMIKAMDCGKLPLDTRLEGDNRSNSDKSSGHPINSAVAEVVEQNQRRTHLGKSLSISQNGQCLIHMRPDAQRIERLQAHPPKWLLFNVPSHSLKQVFTPQMIKTLASMHSAPIMVLSAKSFIETQDKVDVPVTDLYKTLSATPTANSSKLQNRLLVLGGYFAAPWLATGSPVHFVVAGKDPQAVDCFANLMPDDHSNAIKHDRRYGKDQMFGTAIMGALKNQAVYAFAREIVQKTYDQLVQFPEWTVEQHCSRLNAWAAPAADLAIENAERAVEQLTAREPLADGKPEGALGLRSITDFKGAPGVSVDFERCMVRPIDPPFVRFVAGLQEILRQPTSVQGQQLQALLAQEVVDSGKGFGSRNSRDGVIDQALRIVFDAQTARGECDSTNFQNFRATWTPASWLAKTTEGRNGMLPILTHLSQHGRVVPQLIRDAATLYGQADPRLLSFIQDAANTAITNETSCPHGAFGRNYTQKYV